MGAFGALLFLGVCVAVAYMAKGVRESITDAATSAYDTVTDYGGQIVNSVRDFFGFPEWQSTIIDDVARQYGIDANFLASLRKTENGRKGREFGVLSPAAMIGDDPNVSPEESFRVQAEWAAGTISKNAGRYQNATGRSATDENGRYTADYIRFFSARYAPVGAGNDPTNLNSNHARNLLAYYGQSGDIA